MGGCASTKGVRLQQSSHEEVHITLEREPGSISLGIHMMRDNQGIVTKYVQEGSSLDQWNIEHPGMEVERGDRILSVNGVLVDDTWTGWCNILAEFRKQTVTIVVRRNMKRPSYHETSSMELTVDHILPGDFLDRMSDDLSSGLGACGECAICLEDLTQEDNPVVLPCRHAFHHSCAEKWFAQCPTFRYARCPTCREGLPLSIGTGSMPLYDSSGADFQESAAVADFQDSAAQERAAEERAAEEELARDEARSRPPRFECQQGSDDPCTMVCVHLPDPRIRQCPVRVRL